MIRRIVATLALAAAVAATACTPEQVAAFLTLSPDDQGRVLAALGAPEGHTEAADCYAAIDQHWPGDREWARRIVWRESRNQPGAKNPRSSARGCWQLLHGYHAWRYSAVGCSPAQWADPTCNTLAAWTLFAEQGARPWGM